MYKLVVFVACLVLATATPVPQPKAKPQYIVDPYVGAVAPVAYSAPLAYSDYVLPSVYAAGYGYSPYVASAPVVVY
ncbi:hypothetical protein D910_06790 [Dendroctonus ponderosae]